MNLHNQNWTFGNNVGIKFPGLTELLPSSNFNSREATSTVSDNEGNLLFYTNGSQYYDANHVQFYNSGGAADTRAQHIIPIDSCEGEYFSLNIATFGNWSTANLHNPEWVDYPFTDEPDKSGRQLKINLIKCNGSCSGFDQNSNEFSFIEEELPNEYTYTEKLAVIPYNGTYLIAIFLRKFIPYPTGSDYVPANPPLEQQQKACLRIYRCVGKTIHFSNDIFFDELAINPYGDMKVSPALNKLALTNWLFSTTILFDIDFGVDPISGNLTIVNLLNKIILDDKPIPDNNFYNHHNCHGGLEFTSNSNYLYYCITNNVHGNYGSSSFKESIIKRYNISNGTTEFVASHDPNNSILYQADDIVYQSGQTVTGFHGLGMFQRGIDSRIYIAIDRTRYVGIIENPSATNSTNINVNFQGFLLSRICRNGLPKPIYSLENVVTSEDELNVILENSISSSHQELEFSDLNTFVNCSITNVKKPKISIFTDEQESNCKKYYIKICSCSMSYTYTDVKIIFLELSTEELEIIPKGVICFGDIKPCSCVVREFLIKGNPSLLNGIKLNIKNLQYGVSLNDQISFDL